MTMITQFAEKSQQLLQKINDAEKLKKPIDSLAKKYINLLEEFHDVFVRHADKHDFSPIDKASGEVKIYGNIIYMAKKIGLPVDKYNKKIFDIRASIMGKQFVKENF